MPPSRRRILTLTTGLAALATVSQTGWAQIDPAYPSRHLTLLVPVGAGGAPDLFARVLGERLAQQLGQPVVIENRPGVGGNLAMQAVVRAPADGHTLLLMTTPQAINATLYPDLSASLARDIAPVIGLAGDNFVVVVTPSMPATTLAEFIAYAKANPGKINIASSGTGNMSHLAAELFKMMAGVDMVHVPYRSAPSALADVMAGNVQAMIDAIPSSRPHIEAGKLRALAVTGKTRHPALPGVPAIDEQVSGYEVTGWMGIGVATSTSAAVINRLDREIAAALADPGVKARLAELGSTKLELSAADFGKLIAADTRKWAEVIGFAGLKPR